MFNSIKLKFSLYPSFNLLKFANINVSISELDPTFYRDDMSEEDKKTASKLITKILIIFILNIN